MSFTFSLYKIQKPDDFGFDPAEYSRFKFGDGEVAASFGVQLADEFIREYFEKGQLHTQLVVIPSPYSYIPTATYAMKNHFVAQLNQWLAEHQLPVVQETKVHRSSSYREDYGALNAEERMKLIGQDSFHIDRAFIEGKTLLFLDDIKITGSHERMIMKMVEEYNLHNHIGLLYFAELANAEIHPNIENHLNYYQVKSIFDLEPIIQQSHFCINTRIVKYLLNYENKAFCLFLKKQTKDFVKQLYHSALGNSYHTIEAYLPNLQMIKEYLFTNNHKLLQHGN